jgi:hypothetical protein
MPVDHILSGRIVGPSAIVPPVAGAVLWLTSEAGLFQTVGGSPATADGSPVGQWQDQSGNGHHIVQPGAGARPLLKLSQVNGYPSVRFDGVDDLLKLNWTLPWPTTVFVVARMIAWTSGRYIYGGGIGDAADLYMSPASPTLRYYTGTSGSGDPMIGTLSVGSWGIVRTWTSTTQKSLRHNANAEAVQAGVAGSQAGICLGAHPNPTAWGNVEFAEVIVYPSVLSSAEETSVRNYLNGKYAVY